MTIRRTLPLLAALLAACGGASRPGEVSPAAAPATASVPAIAAVPADVTASVVHEPAVPPQVAWLSGLMPLRSTGVLDFLAAHPTADGRGVLIAILDSGLDARTYGLITTSAGAPKILDLRDFSGEGRIALTRVTPNSDGSVSVGGRKLLGTGRIGRLTGGDAWYAGVWREQPLGRAPAADVNGNGTTSDVFPVIVVKAADGWVAFLDSNRDGSFEDEQPLHDYRAGRETIAFGTRPLTIAANFAEVDGAPLLDLYFDTSGHGTHVAGIAAGHNLFNVAQFNGVAPGAQLLGLKIANDARGGPSNGAISVTHSILRAMDYAARFAQQRNLPLVLNLSFGTGNEMPGHAVLDSAINVFLAAHPAVVYTISAGNDGPGVSTINSPGSADLAFSVGASFPGAFARPAQPNTPAADDVPGWWSSRGGAIGKPDILTPGLVFSSVPPWDRGNEIKGGTSMAAPHAAGLVACLISALAQDGRSATAAELMQALRATAVPFAGLTALDQGAGVPRLEAAYRWLVAGHQGSEYVVRSVSGGSGSAVLRRDGFAGPGDTLDHFLVRHVLGLRAAQFTLSSDASWLAVPSNLPAAPGITDIPVTYRPAALSAPGLYVGRVTARNPNDLLAGPLFTLVSSVVVPYDLAAKPVVDEQRAIAAAAVQRYFLRVGRAGSTLRATVILPDSNRQTATVRLFEPTGRAFRDEDEDLPVGREDGGTATLVVRAEDLVAGVYELDVIAPPLKGVTATVRAEAVSLALAAAGPDVEITNAGLASAAVRVATALVGAERRFDVLGRGAPTETLSVRVPEWAARTEIDVSVPQEEWNALTDFGVTLFDSSGVQVDGKPLNYAFGRGHFDVPPALAGRPLGIELAPAFAVAPPPPPDSSGATGWRATVRVRFLLAEPAVAGAARDLTVVAGGRMTTALPTVTGVALPDRFQSLFEMVVTPAGTGAGAVGRFAAGGPTP